RLEVHGPTGHACAVPRRKHGARQRVTTVVSIGLAKIPIKIPTKIPTWREIRAAYGRRRRALRKAMLEPVLVGWPVLREVVTNALAARGHLVLCELGDVRFFVDPGDRVVGAWLMWHGGWQRREINSAVDLLLAAGRLHS